MTDDLVDVAESRRLAELLRRAQQLPTPKLTLITGCKRCGKPLAYAGALFCGAACSARWEDGDREK